MARCNNYSIYDMNLNLNEFEFNLPYIYFIDDVQIVHKKNGQTRYKRIKIEYR